MVVEEVEREVEEEEVGREVEVDVEVDMVPSEEEDCGWWMVDGGEVGRIRG